MTKLENIEELPLNPADYPGLAELLAQTGFTPTDPKVVRSWLEPYNLPILECQCDDEYCPGKKKRDLEGRSDDEQIDKMEDGCMEELPAMEELSSYNMGDLTSQEVPVAESVRVEDQDEVSTALMKRLVVPVTDCPVKRQTGPLNPADISLVSINPADISLSFNNRIDTHCTTAQASQGSENYGKSRQDDVAIDMNIIVKYGDFEIPRHMLEKPDKAGEYRQLHEKFLDVILESELKVLEMEKQPRGRKRKEKNNKQNPSTIEYPIAPARSPAPNLFPPLSSPAPRLKHERAALPYPIIAGLALYNARVPVATREIYRFAKHYFPNCVTSLHYKNSLRHALCTSDVFMKVRAPNGISVCEYYWGLVPEKVDRFLQTVWDLERMNGPAENFGMADPSKWEAIKEGRQGLPHPDVEIDLGDEIPTEKARRTMEVRINQEPSSSSIFQPPRSVTSMPFPPLKRMKTESLNNTNWAPQMEMMMDNQEIQQNWPPLHPFQPFPNRAMMPSPYWPPPPMCPGQFPRPQSRQFNPHGHLPRPLPSPSASQGHHNRVSLGQAHGYPQVSSPAAASRLSPSLFPGHLQRYPSPTPPNSALNSAGFSQEHDYTKTLPPSKVSETPNAPPRSASSPFYPPFYPPLPADPLQDELNSHFGQYFNNERIFA